MARDGVPVSPELAALVTRYAAGERFNVRVECARVGASKTAFYKYVGRFRERGVEGLFPSSRTPHSSPARVSLEVEDAIVRIRKELGADGWDAGAEQIAFFAEDLVAAGDPSWPEGVKVPARATINRILTRRGQLVSVPQRRPKKADRRFEAKHPNTRWQMDGFKVTYGELKLVVLHITDDHSRFDIALRAVRSENGADVWDTFVDASTTHGLPRELLTDNGTAFSGHRRGWISDLDRNLATLGVKHITSSIAHPQTCGKCERAHKTVLKWLRVRDFTTIEELNAALETYRDRHNNRRRRTHLDGQTPGHRYRLGIKDGPDGPGQVPTVIKKYNVQGNGASNLNKTIIGLGNKYAGQQVTAFRRDREVTILNDQGLIAEFTLKTPRGGYQSVNPNGRLSPKS